MTAINPAKLKIQAAQLGDLLETPTELIPKLHDLLAFYGARIRQTSLSKIPLSLQSYQVPTPVLIELEIEFKERIENNPLLGLSLADALWSQHWVEFRQLAVFVLGCLSAEDPDPILERIQKWLNDCSSEDIRRQIMTTGLQRLSREKSDLCLSFIQNLATSEEKADHQAALYGLAMYGKKPDFANLPLLYKILGEILNNPESGLIKEISSLLGLLVERSEQETAYFLAQQLKSYSTPRTERITRMILKSFSAENQGALRKLLSK